MTAADCHCCSVQQYFREPLLWYASRPLGIQLLNQRTDLFLRQFLPEIGGNVADHVCRYGPSVVDENVEFIVQLFPRIDAVLEIFQDALAQNGLECLEI